MLCSGGRTRKPQKKSCLQIYSTYFFFLANRIIFNSKFFFSYNLQDDEWPNIIIVKGEGDWTASEELSLLKSIEVLGFGNWSGLSAILENRSPDGK